MSGRRCVAVLAAAIVACAPAAAQELGIPQASDTAARAAERASHAGTTWLMAAVAPGLPDRLSIFRSDDGTTFVTQASEAYAPPRGMLRDPAIVRQDGQYRVAYVAGAGNAIGLARSSDLKHWTFVRTVPMPGPVRAPRWVRTGAGGVKLVVALAQGPALVEPDGAAAPRVLAGLQDRHEDAAIVQDGDGYVALTRRRADGVLELARARDLAGPWAVERTLDALGRTAPGAGLARRPDGGWRIVFADAAGHAWQADSRDAMRTWTDKRALAGVAAGVAAPDLLAERAQDVANAVRPARVPQQVGWDPYSLTVDGKRVVVWSGEMHPFRLPESRALARRDPEDEGARLQRRVVLLRLGLSLAGAGRVRFFRRAQCRARARDRREEGMYVIARTGPYVNAELSGGGFPGWMFRNRAEARTDDPAYLAAVDEWMTQIERHHRAPPGDDGRRQCDRLPDRERIGEGGAEARAPDGPPGREGARGRHHGAVLPQRGRPPARLDAAGIERALGQSRTDRHVRLRRLSGRQPATCMRIPAGPNKAPDWGIYAAPGPKAGALSSPGTPGFGGDRRAAGSTTGARTAPTVAPPSARARATSACSTAPT
jgi:hypothetical protein